MIVDQSEVVMEGSSVTKKNLAHFSFQFTSHHGHAKQILPKTVSEDNGTITKDYQRFPNILMVLWQVVLKI